MANQKKKQLPDTPWHIGYPKKDEDDPRRHKARCIHILTSGTCMCANAGCYMMKRNTSSHCKFYSETASKWNQIQKDTETARMEEEKRIQEWAGKKRREIQKDDNHPIHFLKLELIKKCPVCGSTTIHFYSGYVFCSCCKTYFFSEKEDSSKSQEFISLSKASIVVGKKKQLISQEPNETSKTSTTEKRVKTYIVCKFKGKNKLCLNPTAKRYKKPCREQCKHYRPIEI